MIFTRTKHQDTRYLKPNPNFNKEYPKKFIKILQGTNSITLGSGLVREEILQIPLRKGIYDLIRKNPGININEMERSLNIGSNQVLWHLNSLEKFQLIKSIRIGNQKAYYNYFLKQTDLEIFFYLRKEKVKKIIDLFKDKNSQSGLNPTKISKQLNMHYNTIRKYLKILHEFGMIKFFVKNNKKIYFLNYHKYNKTMNGIKRYSKQVRSNIVQEFLSAF
jgi:predicted transcriptional regulator